MKGNKQDNKAHEYWNSMVEISSDR